MKKKSDLQIARDEKRKLAEADLVYFIELVHPKRFLGNIHREVIKWWTGSNASLHQLLLLPRDHMKSALAAYLAAWLLTRDPTLRILYISSTSNLATKQLKFIKDILISDKYRMYWPEMVSQEETRREKWTEREISIDHPKRKEWSIREPSIFTAGLTTNIVGLHCDVAILDDVVVVSNAYTEEGRDRVRDQYGYLSSIEGVNAREIVVGTRYHPLDLYSTLLEMESDIYNDVGQIVETKQLFEVFERPVENAGDGTGEFLWPRAKSPEGKWFGFDPQTLSDKRNKYSNRIYFRAQYYNDPQDIDSSPIQRALFQYYDQNFIYKKDYQWYFRGNRLNVAAAVDFAFSTNKKADSTSIVVVGVDSDQNYYILEIDRFKTDKISEYYAHILALYQKWGFRSLRCEVSVAQGVIVNDLKDNYIRKHGLGISIDEFRPSRWEGSKQERIMSTLEPKYANHQIWHYPSGNTQILEEELILQNPAHDDVKDALTSVIDFLQKIAPYSYYTVQKNMTKPQEFHTRFGGAI